MKHEFTQRDLNDNNMQHNSRTNSANESSEDGSSSLEPQPSAPPTDEHDRSAYKMGSDQKADHRYSSFADAVVNGHAGTPTSAAHQINNNKGVMGQAAESSNQSTSSAPQDAHLHYLEETTQPLSTGQTSQMSFTFETHSRANTPSGIMREMSLAENDGKSHQYTGCVNNIGREIIERVSEHQQESSKIMCTTSYQPSVESPNYGMDDITASKDASGVGAMLSQYRSQTPQQQQTGPGHITTYYSMASQCSLPIHTPTAVASDNERMRKLSKEFLRSPEHSFEKLSCILGRGRLVMVRTWHADPDGSEVSLCVIDASHFH